MLELLGSLNTEVVASGIVGLIMVGVVVRNAILGWLEARKKMGESERSLAPLASVVGAAWDRDQIERLLQLVEAIADAIEVQVKSIESIAKAQGIMSDRFQQTTQSKLNDILERLEHAEKAQAPRRRNT